MMNEGFYGVNQPTNHVLFNDDQITIRKLIVVPTKTYNGVYRRSYETNTTQQTLMNIENVVGETLDRGIEVDPGTIANVAPDLLRIADVPDKRVDITNGWGTVRLRFLMEVESAVVGGSTEISYIQGYTDKYDPSLSGHLDPNMKFFINSITNTVSTFIPQTGMISTRINKSFNVIYNPEGTFNIENTHNMDRLIRPKDIVNNLTNAYRYDTIDSANFTDTRSIYGPGVETSKRVNNIGVNYISNMLNAVSANKEYSGISHLKADHLSASTSELAEHDITSIPFIRALAAKTGMVGNVTFTLSDLEILSPNLDIIVTGDNQNMFLTNPIMDTEITEDIGKVTMEATIAATITDSVTNLLLDNSLSSISMQITNMTADSSYVEVVSDCKTYITGVEPTMFINKFLHSFKQLVMPVITKHNLIGVDIYIHSDILNDTTVAVSLNGGHRYVYRLPSFCNNLYNSLITKDDRSIAMTEELNQVLVMTNLLQGS